MLQQASFVVAVGTDARGEVFDCWFVGLWVPVDHGSNTQFLVVRVAHLGRWPVSEEVHQGADGHVPLFAVQVEGLVRSYRGEVCVIRVLLLSESWGLWLRLARDLFESNSVSVGERRVFVEITVVSPELGQSTERELAGTAIVNSVITAWRLLHGLLVLGRAVQELVDPTEHEVHPLI